MRAGLIKGEGFAVGASIVNADASRKRAAPGEEPVDWTDPKIASRAVQEYVDGLNVEQLDQPRPASASLTDPQASWTCAAGGPAYFAYSTNYLIDAAHGVIVDVQAATANRAAETEITEAMIERVQAQFVWK